MFNNHYHERKMGRGFAYMNNNDTKIQTYFLDENKYRDILGHTITTGNICNRNFYIDENNCLSYNGRYPGVFHIFSNFTFESINEGPQNYSFCLFKNGIPIESTITNITTLHNNSKNAGFSIFENIRTGDTLDLKVKNNNSMANIIVTSYNITIIEL